MNNPKISIIIPIYNSAKYLKSCLNSVIHQNYSNLEIILIDDGSTDQSSQIIKQFAKKDPRVKVIHQKNQGQSTARNVGLEIASGDYISFVDSDDSIDKNFISQLLKPFNNSKIVLSLCSISRHHLNNDLTEQMYSSPMIKQSPHQSNAAYILKLMAIDGRLYTTFNKLYLARYAKKCRFDKKLNFAEDTKFVLDYLKLTKSADFAFITKPLYTYNFGTQNSTFASSSLVWQNWQKSFQNLKKWLGTHPTLQERFWLTVVHLRWRISYLLSILRAKK